ncbi:MAG: hypothetical protein M1368_07395 [Thaumarchaeota archaeon]|nr:hypothetical protein [Nitrososphaerota archaeon]
MSISVIHLGHDVVIIALVAGFGLYGFRSFLVLTKYKELKDVKRLWLPVITSGFLFFLWALEDLIIDIYNMMSDWNSMIKVYPTLLAAILLFLLGIVRFPKVWLEYVRNRNKRIKENHAREHVASSRSLPPFLFKPKLFPNVPLKRDHDS